MKFSYYLLLTIVLLHCTIQCADTQKSFRNYDEQSPVAQFYKEHHHKQTLDFAITKKQQYLEQISRGKNKMTVWQALTKLNSIVDDSDPDTQLPQIQHALQTAEKLRADNQPRWFILTGLIHDLGKMLLTFGESQWAVVGDTFPVGCKYHPSIIYFDYLKNNPDTQNELLQTQCGIYRPHCGLDAVHMSFGHDEYLYHVVKDSRLPQEALYIIRYHSFYPQHQHNAYDHLLNRHDQKMFEWVKKFQAYDLYSKTADRVDIDKVKAFYQELIDEYFPNQPLSW